MRQMVVDLDHPTLGTLRTLGTPIKAAGERPFRPFPPPGLGEHTESVLRDLLGYPPERIQALRSGRVIT
jgi:crotonobetainyl-CoA:carnitine CoA-transferase CaiB-like acyl-CoA transferase